MRSSYALSSKLKSSDTVTNARPIKPTNDLVRDITAEEEKYTLDVHGFRLVRHESNLKEFDVSVLIESEYYRECEEVYK